LNDKLCIKFYTCECIFLQGTDIQQILTILSLSSKQKAQLADADLLEHYLDSGDLEWLGILYNRYIHLVYGVCLKYLREREASKDAVSWIFEKLMVEIPKFDIRNFKSWLYVLVKNHCLMELRKQQSAKRQHEEFFLHADMESTHILHPLDEKADDKLERQLQNCLDRLKKEQQDCIRLFYYEEKCYREIAQTLEMEEKTVKSHIQNGKRNLKICLDQPKKDEDEI